MADVDRLLGMYLHLARASHARQQPMVCDKLLVLAGVQAEKMGLTPISALCRHKILAHNGRHLVRRWPTMAEALGDERFQSYLKQLRRRYSPEKIEHMIASLGIELGREREAYFSDLEYAAALLDARPEAIDAMLTSDARQGIDGRRQGASKDELGSGVGAAGWRERVLGGLAAWGPFLLGLIVAATVGILRFLHR